MSAKNGVTKCCEMCGKEYYVPLYRSKESRFCSRSCVARFGVAKLNATRKKATSNPSWFKTEQVTGSNNPKWVESIVVGKCEYCGNDIVRKPWQTNYSAFAGKYCSGECRNRYRHEHESGANSPFWVGGPDGYRGRDWRALRLIVVQKQNGICVDCGRYIGESLPVHHIKPYRLFRTTKEANSINNLIGLCQSCHMKRETSEEQMPGIAKDYGFECNCVECGTTFVASHARANWCDDCRTKTCQHCGKIFRPILRNEVNKFCSQNCHFESKRHKVSPTSIG